MLDNLSADAVRQFVTTADGIRSDLKLDLDLLGAVATFSRTQSLSKREELALKRIQESCTIWGAKHYGFEHMIPLRADIAAAAGVDVAYCSAAGNKQIFDALGDEIWQLLFPAAQVTSEGS